MQKKWKIKEINLNLQGILSAHLQVNSIVAQILINRGIADIQSATQFLKGDFSTLYDPFLLKDMDKAVERIKAASEKNERVLIFGDYDVDGITSSVILHNTLSQLGIDVLNYIPHRMDEGYGLNEQIVEYAVENKISLLISVDCGITAIKEVQRLSEKGIDVIVLDHHEPSEQGLPKAVAIIDPKRTDCSYPFKFLAAAGIVAKLAMALLGTIDDETLGLAAMGTIADVAPMKGENRIFAKEGLLRFKKIKNKGLLALLDVTKIRNKTINNFHIGFVLGPRINAAGRMDSAHESLKLFLTKDEGEAYTIAATLDRYNSQRRNIQADMVKEAFEIIEKDANFSQHKVMVLSKEGWHKGLLGIVASRITERFYRPAIVISVKDGVGTASARSIDGFHLCDALSDCREYLEKFGGHKGAAGLTIKEENIDNFRSSINKIAADSLSIKKLVPTIDIDAQISLSDLNVKLAHIISSLEPFGEENPEPLFCSFGLKVQGRPRLLGKDTIKFWVTDNNVSISAVGFGMAKYNDLVSSGKDLDLAYNISIDDWNKAPVVQLKLKDIKISDPVLQDNKEERLFSRS